MAAWLRQILTRNLAHTVRDFGRDKRNIHRECQLKAAVDNSSVRLAGLLAADQSSPSQRASRNEQVLALAEVLETLNGAQREAIVLHYLQGWSLADVAEHLDRSTSAVAGLLHRGLAKLRGQLQDRESGP